MGCKYKGISRKEVAQQSLERRKFVLKLVYENKRIETNELVVMAGYEKSVLYKHLLRMVESGHVICEKEIRRDCKAGRTVNWFSPGPNTEPLVAYEHGSAKPCHVKDPTIKRIFKKARQIGLPRDPLIAAFFGPAVRA